MIKVKTVRVRTNRWKVIWRNLSGEGTAEEDKALGWCHENKVIELDPNLSDSLLCEIALHEFSHAFFPDMSEETVTQFASQAADFLSAMNLISYEDEEDDLR